MYAEYIQAESRNNMRQYGRLVSNGEKLKMNWHTILFNIKMTSPVEFCRAVNLFVVILGSKRVIITIHEIKTNITEKMSVTVV